MTDVEVGEEPADENGRVGVLEEALTTIVLQLSTLCPAAPYEDVRAVLISCARLAGAVLGQPGRRQSRSSESLTA